MCTSTNPITQVEEKEMVAPDQELAALKIKCSSKMLSWMTEVIDCKTMEQLAELVAKMQGMNIFESNLNAVRKT